MDEIIIDGVIGSPDADPKEIVYSINNSSGDLKIKINSVGGSVFGGFSIYNALKEYSNGNIIVEIDAKCASIATYIAMAGNKIIAKSNSTFMIHNAWMPAIGDFIELRKAANISEGLSSIMANAYATKSKMGKSDALSLMAKETFYYGAEMLDAGFVDEIINVDGTEDRPAAYSVTMESIKACNKFIIENEDVDFEAVAKLIPKKEAKTPKVVDLSAQQQREREIFILQQGVK